MACVSPPPGEPQLLSDTAQERLSLLTHMNSLLELDLCGPGVSMALPSSFLPTSDHPDSEPCLGPEAHPRIMAPALTHRGQGPLATASMSALKEYMFHKQVKMKTNKTHSRPGPDYSRANSAPSPPPPSPPPHHHQECPEHLHTCRGKPHGP